MCRRAVFLDVLRRWMWKSPGDGGQTSCTCATRSEGISRACEYTSASQANSLLLSFSHRPSRRVALPPRRPDLLPGAARPALDQWPGTARNLPCGCERLGGRVAGGTWLPSSSTRGSAVSGGWDAGRLYMGNTAQEAFSRPTASQLYVCNSPTPGTARAAKEGPCRFAQTPRHLLAAWQPSIRGCSCRSVDLRWLRAIASALLCCQAHSLLERFGTAGD
jgi:hypothetical protein